GVSGGCGDRGLGGCVVIGDVPAGFLAEQVVVLAQCMQVADAGGAVVAPALRVIELRVVGGAVAVRHAAFAIPGAYEVFDGGRGSAGCAADIEHGAGGGVGDHFLPDAARVVQDFPGDRT